MSVNKVMLSKLTAKQAKTWLLKNDTDASLFWQKVTTKSELIAAVVDNLRSFGLSPQSGKITITSNCEAFTKDYRNKWAS